MADRLVMYVVAVGQGSCGLAAHYDSAGNLIQLDLCDCGYQGGKPPEDTLEEQMQFIHELMAARAAAHEGDADLYLDNVIISHRDRDHLSLFTDEFLFKDIEPASEAERQPEAGIYERSRIIPFPQIEAVDDPPGDDEEFLTLRATYNKEGDVPQYITASVEYICDNADSPQSLASRLSYQQRYSMSDGGGAGIDEALCYHGFVDHSKLPPSSDISNLVFDFNLKASPGTGYLFWQVSSHTGLSEDDDHWGIELTVEQKYPPAPPPDGCANFSLYRNDTNLAEGCELPIGPPCCPPWEQDFLGEFNGYTNEVLGVLLEKVIPALGEYSKIFHDVVSAAQELYAQSFQQMMEMLEPRFPIFLYINGDFICDHLFTPERMAAPNDGLTMAIGRIYIGGKEPTGHTRIAGTAISMLDTYCHYMATQVDGIARPTPNIALIQMPHVYPYKIDCGEEKETTKDVIGKENDLSIMYIALDHKGCRAIFPGDATGITMKYFIDMLSSQEQYWLSFSETWLAAPHHGSWETCKNAGKMQRESPLEEYLQLLSPSFILISSGYENQFNHPRTEFLKVAFPLVSKEVSPHYLYYYDREWTIKKTGAGLYSTVTVDPDGDLCYADLIMDNELQEPYPEPIKQLDVQLTGQPPLAATEQNSTRPLLREGFPFLFDEPSALDAFAL